jgi:hypothetical protein
VDNVNALAVKKRCIHIRIDSIANNAPPRKKGLNPRLNSAKPLIGALLPGGGRIVCSDINQLDFIKQQSTHDSNNQHLGLHPFFRARVIHCIRFRPAETLNN